MALIDDFKTRFPEFDNNLVDSYFDSIEAQYFCYYPIVYNTNAYENEKILLLLAHLFTIETKRDMAPARVATSQGTGSVSVSFSAGLVEDFNLFFNSTKFGQRFLMIASSRQGGIFV